ncbi:MAG TPA: valine--tRNA ligase [Patescibacteria group bacterium]|nr:valine--tRNA ligase [Patescibacteria group bacterium]
MDKTYNHKLYEEKIYKKWETSGYFNPDNLPGERKETFSIVLPPPNVTGTLHLGHAAMLAVEDILVRYNRMQGKKTVWIPGTDSAAIATQSKVESVLYKEEGKTRHDIGRTELMNRIEAFIKDSESTIISQVKRMGSSLDWSRYAYTLDGTRYKAVMEAFVRMYKAGLIYRGNRIVNWDPQFQTTVADDEIEYKEQIDPFYYFKYGPFTIGTVRPETKFGDKYVVMHPDDKRYKKYKHGDKIKLEWINGPLTATIIKDTAADPEVGSGVMTITPSHSFVDFEIAKRHNLDIEQVIDEKGLLLPIAGEFAGQHIKKARPLIVEKLKQKGLIEKVDEKYIHKIAINYRGGGTIEPQIKLQWWVDVNKEIPERDNKSLKDLMREAIKSGATKITPSRFEKTYYHWIDNLRDWCISRQIWFGHRIPVWYKGEEIFVGTEAPKEKGWEQDPDTLDTWFSSGLWTFSTLGWPEQTEDLKNFHPTSLLETGYDILFFWVARMILMSSFLLGEVPFKQVYLHGLVRDNQGRKMSKSLGNIINPVDMIDKYGADAVRMSLIIGAAPGNDIKLSEDRIRGYRNFANKVWNITRFVTESESINTKSDKSVKTDDEWILEELKKTTLSVTKNLDKFKLNEAAEEIYDFVWHKFADIYIEKTKTKDGDNFGVRESAVPILQQVLEQSLKILHPFMPFVTEQIWHEMENDDLLLITAWPKV